MTNPELRSQWASESSDVWPPRSQSTARVGAGVSALHRVSSKITPQMISLSHDIETLHILLEHFYDSQRNAT